MKSLFTVAMLLIGVWSFSQQRQKEESYISQFDKITIDYLIYFPKDYDSKSAQKYPLMIWHHGVGEKCWQCSKTTSAYATLAVNATGLTNVIEKGLDLPFIVVSPRDNFGGPNYPTVNGKSVWNPCGWTNEVFDTILKRYPKADVSNLLLGGLSEGGNGVFNYISDRKARKLKAAIICSGWASDDSTLSVIAANNIPLYDARAEFDATGGLASSLQSYYKKAMAKGMSKPKMTVYTGNSHPAGWINFLTNNNAATSSVTWDPATSVTNKWQDWISSNLPVQAPVQKPDTIKPVPVEGDTAKGTGLTVIYSYPRTGPKVATTNGIVSQCYYSYTGVLDTAWKKSKDQPPVAGFPYIEWQMIAKGSILFPYASAWEIGAGADDGHILVVGGDTIVKDWSNHVYREKTKQKTVNAGRLPISYSYYNAGYNWEFKLFWRPDSFHEWEVIPKKYLYAN